MRKMRTGLLATVLLMIVLLLVPPPLAVAREAGGFHGHAGAGVGHAWGGWHGRRGFHGHGGGSGVIVLGPDLWGNAPWWWAPPYPDDTSPDYTAPPVVVQPSPPAYWYYCPEARAYYPYVQHCPSGWLTVVPPTAAAPSGPTPSLPPS